MPGTPGIIYNVTMKYVYYILLLYNTIISIIYSVWLYDFNTVTFMKSPYNKLYSFFGNYIDNMNVILISEYLLITANTHNNYKILLF